MLELNVLPSQRLFVASNAVSFAEAWFHKEICRPFAVMADEEPVGFFMGGVDHKKNHYTVWRLMIDHLHQGKGYGRAALSLAVSYLKAQGAKDIHLSYQPMNSVAAKLYESMGFVPTGEVEDDGEIVAKLTV